VLCTPVSLLNRLEKSLACSIAVKKHGFNGFVFLRTVFLRTVFLRTVFLRTVFLRAVFLRTVFLRKAVFLRSLARAARSTDRHHGASCVSLMQKSSLGIGNSRLNLRSQNWLNDRVTVRRFRSRYGALRKLSLPSWKSFSNVDRPR